MSMKKKAVLCLFANAIAINMGSDFSVIAQEFNDASVYLYDEESAANFSANYSTMRYNDSFRTNSSITISGSEYKDLILKNIRSIPAYKEKPTYYVDLLGLQNLKGDLTYTIRSSQPVKVADLYQMVSWNKETWLDLKSSKWIPSANRTDAADGIQLIFEVNWGALLKQSDPCKLDIFEDSSNRPSDLNINVSIRNLELATKLKLNTTFILSSEVNEYTINSDSSGLRIKYEKITKDEYGDEKTEKVDAPKVVNEKVNTGLPKSTFSIRIGEKRTLTNTGGDYSQNNPTMPSQPPVDNSNDIVVLRVYNPVTGEHLFTSNAAERTHLVANGWKNEYCEWNTPSTSETPIYRLCNPNNDDHHYTANVAEKDMLVQLGWRYEGVHFYSAAKDEGIPVYRVYNPNATGVGSHHYTSSKAECDTLTSYGWNFEGIAWFGIAK